jgi:isocitrate dehydrogenase (NAD+)
MHKITWLPGDGIGPEVTGSTIKVINATGVKIDWERVEIGEKVLAESGKPLTDDVFDIVKKNKIAIKGPTTTPIVSGHSSANVALRKGLNLYACVRPIKSISDIRSLYKDLDIVVIRENTEGLYTGKEQEIVPGVVECLKIVTEQASRKIARFAFEYAKKEGRKKVTAVHKANIMKMTDGLFLSCVREISKDYPKIQYEEGIVDSTCMQLVTNPYQYDVLVMGNLYGDIISDLCAGLIGGLGVAPGANFGDGCAIFESVHGSAPDIAGKNIANPIASILSGALMLRYIGEDFAAKRIEDAIKRVVKQGMLTKDLGGNSKTDQITSAIEKEL